MNQQAEVLPPAPPQIERLCEVCNEPMEQVPSELANMGTKAYRYLGAVSWTLRYWQPVPHAECEQEQLRRDEERRLEHERREAEESKQRHVLWQDWLYEKKLFLPTDAREKTFENFEVGDDQASIDLIRAWNIGDSFGLFLLGPAGSGKSHLLQALFNYVASDEQCSRGAGYSLAWFPVSIGLDRIRSEMSDGSDRTKRDATESTFLFVDDLGAENPTEWAREQLYQIFDHRLTMNLPTFISTNLTASEVKARYHERFMSRIKEMCVIVQLKGRDRRTDKMKENIQTLKARLK